MIQITHGLVCVTVLGSLFRYGSVCAVFRGKKDFCQIITITIAQINTIEKRYQ